jgi:transposase
MEGIWIGIDVSKKKLDAAVWVVGKKYRTLKVDNDAAGFAALLLWSRALASGLELRFCMESTGDYGFALALYLVEEGEWVSVVNPAWIKHYGRALGRLNKTDTADAKLIAQYALERKPHEWTLKEPGLRNLFRLHRRREQLKTMVAMEDNRTECPQAVGPACMASVKRVLKALKAEQRDVEKQILQLINEHSKLKTDVQLIHSLPPLAQNSAVAILAEMPDVNECQAAPNYAAQAGVNPTLAQSGSSVRGSSSMSRGGRKVVRAVLQMPTLRAIKTMPEVKAIYDRLRARGKKHRQAMVAAMRKLLMIVYGVLKHRRPYIPNFNLNT